MAKKNSNMGTGSGVSYTVDPTVNGPWTHTRADIPLFKTAPVTTPTTPTSPTGTTGTTPNRGVGGGAGGLGGAGGGGMSWQQMRAQNGPVDNSWQAMKARTTPVANTWQNMKAGVMRGSGMALGGAGRGNNALTNEKPILGTSPPPSIGGELPPVAPTETGGMPVSAPAPVTPAAPARAYPSTGRIAPRQRAGYANALTSGTYGKTI